MGPLVWDSCKGFPCSGYVSRLVLAVPSVGAGGRVSMETGGSPSLHCQCCENKAESLIWPVSLAQALNMFAERRRRRALGISCSLIPYCGVSIRLFV